MNQFLTHASFASPQDNPVDFNDPNFLSTTNPHWVEAGLSQKVIDVLSEKGIVRFTPVQAEAFGPISGGTRRDWPVPDGTGKTLAFGLPGLTRIVELAEKKGIRDPRMVACARDAVCSMLVLCPTRELARQVQEELAMVARPLGLYVEVFHGGVSYDGQVRKVRATAFTDYTMFLFSHSNHSSVLQNRALRNGVDVLVGTPGRVIDHIKRGNLDLSEM